MLKLIKKMLSYIDNLFLLGLAVGIYIYWICISVNSYKAEDFTGAWDFLGEKINALSNDDKLKIEYKRLAKLGDKSKHFDFIQKNLPKFRDAIFD
tara:strand:- start:839 stop:1123 length:285 start_codon:yes stop_codon:yes gene_type:complete